MKSVVFISYVYECISDLDGLMRACISHVVLICCVFCLVCRSSSVGADLGVIVSLILLCCLVTLLVGAAGRTLWTNRLHVSTCVHTAKMAAPIGLFSSVGWITVTQDRTANWEMHCSLWLHILRLSLLHNLQQTGSQRDACLLTNFLTNRAYSPKGTAFTYKTASIYDQVSDLENKMFFLFCAERKNSSIMSWLGCLFEEKDDNLPAVASLCLWYDPEWSL